MPELNSKILHGSYSRHRCTRGKNVMVRGSDVLKRELFTAVGVMKCDGKNHFKKKRQSGPFRCFSTEANGENLWVFFPRKFWNVS